MDEEDGDIQLYTAPNTAPNASPVSGQSTPGFNTLGITFTPRRAMASFENLVALANHQERLREARRMVWRDKGEPVAELDDLNACLKHAAKGGFREYAARFLYAWREALRLMRHYVLSVLAACLA
jgi:hypothetical protein